MIPEIFNYLKTQNVGVLAVEMLDGSPHAATLHFAHSESPFTLYFKTDRDYRKSESLFGRKVSRASFVVGSNENDMKTVQLDGTVELVQAEEMEAFRNTYYTKFPKKKDKTNDPKAVFFKFTTTWWRFTDWTTPQGKMVWVSKENV